MCIRDRGVEVAIFLYEISPNEYKVSLRSSKDVDVSVIAVSYTHLDVYKRQV